MGTGSMQVLVSQTFPESSEEGREDQDFLSRTCGGIMIRDMTTTDKNSNIPTVVGSSALFNSSVHLVCSSCLFIYHTIVVDRLRQSV